MKHVLESICLLMCLAVPCVAAPVDFVQDVRPILQKHCYECHADQKRKSGLRLDVRSEALKGGELYGASIIAGKAAESPLIQFIADEDADLTMPPEGKGLPAEEIDILTRWVNEGAHWPKGVDLVTLDDPLDHWSFQPISNPAPPSTQNPSWAKNPIDQFILAKLESVGLQPSSPADRVDWLRRVYFDLIGLPPTPEQVESFLNDNSELAYERVVEELLSSPRYGERWAQHWLDVVRYADTHGFEVNTERPNAWPYRDYVIRAFNQDTPYDLFVREQLAGDSLEKDAATGFLVTASVLLPGQVGKDEQSKRLARQDSLDEIVINITQSFLGLSVGCARCHDHKFDPISHRDYYELQALVAGVHYGDRDMLGPEDLKKHEERQRDASRIVEIKRALDQLEPLANTGNRRPAINPERNVDRFAPVRSNRIRFTITATNSLEPCIDELEVFNVAGENIALASLGTKTTSSGDRFEEDRHELRFVNDGQYANTRSWMSNKMGQGWIELEFDKPHEVDRIAWGRDQTGHYKDRLATEYHVEIATEGGEWRRVADSTDRRKQSSNATEEVAFQSPLTVEETKVLQQLNEEKARLIKTLESPAPASRVFAGIFRTPDEIHLLTRGDPEQPKDVVSPAVLSALGDHQLPLETQEQERRQFLAEWLTRTDNPLTARVMANRIWQGHFGVGLVDTPNDFGHSGQPPSHPELLDWLASEFMRSGWSIKQMHKLIVLSATYRQASTGNNREAQDVDSSSRLLWRYPSRRLDGETIRDAMLMVSAELNLKMFGSGYNLFNQRGGLSGFDPVEHYSGEGLRRMIYAHKVRREPDAVFGAFDIPDAGQSTDRRRESTTPIQSLNLLNSSFTLDRSEAFANRIQEEAGDNLVQQLNRAWNLTYSRSPTAEELADAQSMVQQYGLANVCRVLLNSNEFLVIP